ncbi:hypothetical protein ANN_21007 [Periplaneta americana]|uniref:Uncharacterized protein n=1 Tax=Periplaneta americana TaxID=6978 RepID=A0ABQ8SE68_PERAM|nr:hypothetical protein ANN_21007 [Periplaneta americana]
MQTSMNTYMSYLKSVSQSVSRSVGRSVGQSGRSVGRSVGSVRRKRMPTSGSRTEFLAVDELGSAGNIHYGRSGGWFVSTKKALLIGLIVISCMVLIGILVHYLGTCKGKPVRNSVI